jgi:glycerol kinase
LDVIAALDVGTTGVRAIAFDLTGQVVKVEYRELPKSYPKPGWVEQDPLQLRDLSFEVLSSLAAGCMELDLNILSLGITNQRETVVCWGRDSGIPLYNAIVWQDRRTVDYCRQLKSSEYGEVIRRNTGLLPDPYFSATKIKWILDNVVDADVASKGLAFGTVDAYIIWCLTGGEAGGAFVTDPSNASRTMLYDIYEMAWSDELCDMFSIKKSWLPEVAPSCGILGEVDRALLGENLKGLQISGVLGDQQAALFGHGCYHAGMAKATYGTGTFLLINTGGTPAGTKEQRIPDGLVASVAWDLGAKGIGGAGSARGADDGGGADDAGGAEGVGSAKGIGNAHGAETGDAPRVGYVLEGSIFSTGATIQWLRDQLNVLEDASEISLLASRVDDSNGLYIVPAFSGLGSPWWDPRARGTIIGISQGVTREHLARATLESIAYQVRDIAEHIRDSHDTSGGSPQPGYSINQLRVDGGVSASNELLQMQADQLGIPVMRPVNTECSALGAAQIAALGAGVYGTLDEVGSMWKLDIQMQPGSERDIYDVGYRGWKLALERSLAWSQDGEEL